MRSLMWGIVTAVAYFVISFAYDFQQRYSEIRQEDERFNAQVDSCNAGSLTSCVALCMQGTQEACDIVAKLSDDRSSEPSPVEDEGSATSQFFSLLLSNTPSAGVAASSRDRCFDASLTDDELRHNRKILLYAHWFCSRAWKGDELEKVASIAYQNKILPWQWLPDDAARNEFERITSKLAAPFYSFVAAVEAATLLVVEGYDEWHHESGYGPTPAVLAMVRGSLNIDQPVTVAGQPQQYVINPSAPRITLVSDVGQELSLHEVATFVSAEQSGAVFDNARKGEGLLPDFVAFFVEAGLTTNPIVGLPVLAMRMLLRASPRSDLPNLTVNYTSSATVRPSGDAIQHRNGFYDPSKEMIWVRVEGPRRPSFNPTYGDANQSVASMLPAELAHELFHYFTYRRTARGSGFVLEGEASHYGERFYRVVGVLPEVRAEEARLYEIVGKIQAGAATAEEIAEYLPLEREVASKAEPTTRECENVKMVMRENVSQGRALDLEAMLSLTPADFQRVKNLPLAYAQAWAVFYIGDVEGQDWRGTLDAAIASFEAGRQLQQADRRMLKQIADRTLAGVASEAVRLSNKCAS